LACTQFNVPQPVSSGWRLKVLITADLRDADTTKVLLGSIF